MHNLLINYAEYSTVLNFLVNFTNREFFNTKSKANLEDLYLQMNVGDNFSIDSNTSFLNNSFYTTFFAHSSCVAILSLNDHSKGQILNISHNCLDIFGYSKSELMG